MRDRTPIPNATETLVLMASARRCALCFGFNGDLTRRKGQIAHIDQNASNANEKNLVYLCVEHHDEYDSTTSQVKGITDAELRAYKERLVSVIATGDHLRPASVQSPAAAKEEAIRGHDERLFGLGNDLLPESVLREFLVRLNSDDSYQISQSRRLDAFRSIFTETGNQFIDTDLSTKSRAFVASIDALLLFLARHFFVYPDRQENDDLRLCMHPDLNIDRGGSGESIGKYDRLQTELDDSARCVRATYDDFRIAVKHHLSL